MKAALAGFEALGLDVEPLLAAVRFSRAQLSDPFAAIPIDRYDRLWQAAFAQQPDPTLPTRAGFAIPFSEFGVLDHLVAAADTIGEALHILNLYLWLVSTNISLEFTHDDGDWVWVLNDPPETSRAITEQWTLAVIQQRFQQQIPGFGIEAVQLFAPASAPPAAFERHWGVPVQLGQPRTGFRLAAGVWSVRNQAADPLLKQTLRTVAQQVELKQIEDAPLVYAIRTRLPEALEEGNFSAEDIAAELGLSKRTLQRKLAAEKISFKALLDMYRQEQAFAMLAGGERDMANIAYALGYNEQSSFNRAFRRWTGRSPLAWLREAEL